MTESVAYRIVLPPGWARIPLLSGTDEAIEAILDAVSGDKVSAQREEVGVELRRAAAAARDGNGVHLYLPVVARYGEPIAASFVVSDISFGALEPLVPTPLVAGLAAGAGGARVFVDGVVCSRTETICAADPAHGMPVPARRVDYVLPVPNDPDRWVLITFSALCGAASPDSIQLVELFDAVMGTLRWTHARTTGL